MSLGGGSITAKFAPKAMLSQDIFLLDGHRVQPVFLEMVLVVQRVRLCRFSLLQFFKLCPEGCHGWRSFQSPKIGY